MSCAAVKKANASLRSKPLEYHQKTPLFYLDSWRCDKQQIIETLFSNGATSKDKTIYTRPPSLPLKVGGVLLLEKRHNISWRGWARESFISTFKVSKTAERSLRVESASAKFVVDGGFKQEYIHLLSGVKESALKHV